MTDNNNDTQANGTSTGLTPEQMAVELAQARREAAEKRIKLKEAEDKLAAKEQDDLKKRGEWEQVANTATADLNQTKAQLEAANKALEIVKETVAKRVAALPDSIKPIVPTSLGPVELLAWLDNAAPILTKPIAPNIDAGAGSSLSTSQAAPVKLTQDQMEMADRMHVSHEEYAKNLEGSFTPRPKKSE